MSKVNCWEYMNCGREPGGKNVSSLGVCPAAMDETADGLNGGKNGGRLCWAIAGTLCDGRVQGTFAEKRLLCFACDFFRHVKDEEGIGRFQILKPGQSYVRS
ncbi:MAG: hypothetical protein D6726_00965 [Nitrospirae bacterium]|nr:MAG: hypothetical protein D6726_00965 [Nitrospirota bacterium]